MELGFAFRANTFRDQDVVLYPRIVVRPIPYISLAPQGPWRRDWARARGDRPIAGEHALRFEMEVMQTLEANGIKVPHIYGWMDSPKDESQSMTLHDYPQ